MLHSYIKSCLFLLAGRVWRDAMELNSTDIYVVGFYLEGFLFGTISVNSPVSRPSCWSTPTLPRPGLYSGIFTMYLLHHYGSQQSIDKAKNILFYALWVLYALSAATIILEILEFFLPETVSIGDHANCLTLFQSLVLQDIEIQYHLGIIQYTVFACCDFIAQFVLVRTTDNVYHYSSNSSKDISLLDCLGLQDSCCDCSFLLSICILTSINFSSFTDWF